MILCSRLFINRSISSKLPKKRKSNKYRTFQDFLNAYNKSEQSSKNKVSVARKKLTKKEIVS